MSNSNIGRQPTELYYDGWLPLGHTSWLLYRGGLLIQWNLLVVTLETQPVGYYTAYTVEPVL